MRTQIGLVGFLLSYGGCHRPEPLKPRVSVLIQYDTCIGDTAIEGSCRANLSHALAEEDSEVCLDWRTSAESGVLKLGDALNQVAGEVQLPQGAVDLSLRFSSRACGDAPEGLDTTCSRIDGCILLLRGAANVVAGAAIEFDSPNACVVESALNNEICDGLDSDCDGIVDELEDGSHCASGGIDMGTGGVGGVVDMGGTGGVGGQGGGGSVADMGGTGGVGGQGGGGSVADMGGTGGVGGQGGGGVVDMGGEGGFDCEPSVEVCDNRDNDCDGSVDEGVNRVCGTNIGNCRAGLQMCEEGNFGACEGEIGPTNEICDNVDNDCDDTIDEGSPETCNGLDDNCDGVIDNIRKLPCEVEDVAFPCHRGTTVCVGGVRICESICDADIDDDNIPDSADNCPKVANNNQLDSDGDGLGNRCDVDRDGDDIDNDIDNCPDTPNQAQLDSDNDRRGNACDNCPDAANFDQADANGDGIGDVCHAPLEAGTVRVVLRWEAEGADFDLHVLHPRGSYFEVPWDIHYNNRAPDWGQPGLDRDATGRNGTQETVLLRNLVAGTYTVGVISFRAEAQLAVSVECGNRQLTSGEVELAAASLYEAFRFNPDDCQLDPINRTFLNACGGGDCQCEGICGGICANCRGVCDPVSGLCD